jgi:hypothetical protein
MKNIKLSLFLTTFIFIVLAQSAKAQSSLEVTLTGDGIYNGTYLLTYVTGLTANEAALESPSTAPWWGSATAAGDFASAVVTADTDTAWVTAASGSVFFVSSTVGSGFGTEAMGSSVIINYETGEDQADTTGAITFFPETQNESFAEAELVPEPPPQSLLFISFCVVVGRYLLWPRCRHRWLPVS